MTLIPGWRKKLRKLWTTRLAMFGGSVGAANEFVPQLQGMLPNGWYIGLLAIIFILRLVAQPDADTKE